MHVGTCLLCWADNRRQKKQDDLPKATSVSQVQLINKHENKPIN